ncbi:peptide ABC transporter substrate-binding protein [Clostridium saccharoperbutylacetonicum]|uniref:peptide ABC transporter substrate-binding protein n=1 Tax=Clostridium saccharoperbutylacetonicum TaxID=36745 RepID=UPI000983F3AF|nr:peptide ABC transporter substrate-binding protein [Clostridium saccharoperbutylacetonicum]AQR98010.1 oligopeptide-binding protein OppA precursor [Clostridium saccharoperbutylacetonicum]NSB33903.1 oligopeptide transport system substrate-binding protein [Clostridium saccharoperbutylacetonicum]
MKKSRVKQLCAVALAATLGLSVLAGCGSKTSDNKSAATGTDKQELMFNLGSDPKTLDPGLNQSVDGSIVIVNAFEGLYKLDDKNKAVPGQAEKCDVSADGLTYTFHLKKDLKWSNGDPVKASDFEYAWKRVINPETASEYSFQMMYIKGAQEYNTGKGTADQVGIKATDDSTLVVTLAAPCAYFLDLTATPTYMPLDQKIVEANKDWATDAKTLVSNGPFKFTDYKIKDQIVLEKNDNYEAKDDVKLSKVTMKLVTEPTSAWASYKSGQFDMVYDVPTSEKAAAIADKSATVFPELGNAYIDFNVSDKQVDPEAAKALKNPKFRQALSMAIDRQSIIDNVLKAKQVAAHSFVPEGIIGPDGKDFENKKYFDPKGNVDEAKKLLAEAGYPDGKGLPQITLLFNPEGGNADVMQPIQDMWKKIGVNVELQTQEWKVFQDTRTAKNYQIARDAWGADYADPMTFLDLFVTTSPQNNAGYSNPAYDTLISSAKKEADATKRYEMLHQAEDMLMADMPIISLWYSNRTHGVKDYVKGIRKDMLGNIFFTNAYIQGKK